LFGYHPAADVAGLVSADGFTGTAEHMYYINRPEIVAKAGFRDRCNAKQEETIVLGCYKGAQSGIYILKITDDDRLNGVMQVTAAHEMLHAAYDRLPQKQKTQVNGWLMDYYQHQLTDDRIKQTIEAYKQTEPDALVDEMHSIFGTEVANLPTPLEQYYTRYFKNRATVVTYTSSYESEFTKRKELVAQYDSRLESLKQLIDQEEKSLQNQAKAINAESARLDSLRGNNQITEYNAAVPPYNQSIARYTNLANVYEQQISQFNQLLKERNSIALEQQQLIHELSGDSIKQIPNN
jgi:hypothetical protein